jgi:sporulation protein YlmC with PRC-barrel domain
MKIKDSLSVCVVALLCLAWTDALRAADDYRKNTGERSYTGAPAKSNKATGLIGMEVRNQNDEKLGSIKDLVVDLQSGKVAYAVLDGGGLLKDKLFAVPLSAFAPSADHKHLILNADKSKMEAAKGFDKDAWPSSSNPEWGADTFWEQRPGITRPGTPNTTPPTSPNQNK